jgi:hypothetical protein
MPRESYLDDEILKEVAGRLRFGTSDIQSRFDDDPRPKPKPWSYPSHPLDELAADFGLSPTMRFSSTTTGGSSWPPS